MVKNGFVVELRRQVGPREGWRQQAAPVDRIEHDLPGQLALDIAAEKYLHDRAETPEEPAVEEGQAV